MIQDILLLGDDRLYQKCSEVKQGEFNMIKSVIDDLHDTLMEFKKINGFGRGIAAPQIGINKRIIYLYIKRPIIIINPKIHYYTDEKETMIEVLDDCMSFPNLRVKVMRYKKCSLDFFDLDNQPRKLYFEDDMAELIQHEYDHLDGILATMRAVDNKAFFVENI